MYIPPFILGILVTIGSELLVIVASAVISSIKKEDKK